MDPVISSRAVVFHSFYTHTHQLSEIQFFLKQTTTTTTLAEKCMFQTEQQQKKKRYRRNNNVETKKYILNTYTRAPTRIYREKQREDKEPTKHRFREPQQQMIHYVS